MLAALATALIGGRGASLDDHRHAPREAAVGLLGGRRAAGRGHRTEVVVQRDGQGRCDGLAARPVKRPRCLPGAHRPTRRAAPGYMRGMVCVAPRNGRPLHRSRRGEGQEVSRPVCGDSLDGKHTDARFCGPSCRRESHRISALLSGRAVPGYQSWGRVRQAGSKACKTRQGELRRALALAVHQLKWGDAGWSARPTAPSVAVSCRSTGVSPPFLS